MSKKLQIYKRLNLIGIIITALFTLYLIIAIPITSSDLDYQKKELVETVNNETGKDLASAKVEQNFYWIERDIKGRLKLILEAVIVNILMLLLFLANLFIFRKLDKQSNPGGRQQNQYSNK